jgi:hypothetical protein
MPPPPPTKLHDYPCQLCAAAYSIHLQTPSISAGNFLHQETEDMPSSKFKQFKHVQNISNLLQSQFRENNKNFCMI